jgi:hypothetical protein
MPQAIGSKAYLAWKPEFTWGVPAFTLSGADTTLGTAVNPGATSITVAGAAGIAAGDVLRVGTADNMEFIRVDSSYTSGTTIPLAPGTPICFRHAVGEEVKGCAPGGMRRLGAIVGFSPSGGIGKLESQAVGLGRKGLKNIRSGSYEVGGSIDVEMGNEGIGFLLVHALGRDYTTEGTVVPGGASTALASSASAGAVAIDVADATGIEAGDYLEVGSGDVKEVVLVDPSYTAGTTIPLDSSTPLRFSHLSGEVVLEKQAPFTHRIRRGDLPSGLTLLVHYADVDSLVLYRGCKVSTLSVEGNARSLPRVRVEFVGKAMQVLGENLFGAQSSRAHTPYAPWEGVIEEGGSEITTVESIRMSIENNIRGDVFRIGSRFLSSAQEGEGKASGSFTYHFFDASLVRKTMFESESSLRLRFIYTKDADHELSFFMPRVLYTGTPHPGLPDSGPISDTKEFTALYDGTEDTDVLVSYKTPEVVI